MWFASAPIFNRICMVVFCKAMRSKRVKPCASQCVQRVYEILSGKKKETATHTYTPRQKNGVFESDGSYSDAYSYSKCSERFCVVGFVFRFACIGTIRFALVNLSQEITNDSDSFSYMRLKARCKGEQTDYRSMHWIPPFSSVIEIDLLILLVETKWNMNW